MVRRLPISIEIDGKTHPIRESGDYGVILDIFQALNDVDLDEQYRVQCALQIFYPTLSEITDIQAAIDKMWWFINQGTKNDDKTPKPILMNWEKDFNIIIAPVNRILGEDVRGKEYLHWWTFLSAYMEIGECTFAQVVSIRSKRAKGKKLEKWEQEYYRENRAIVDLPRQYTEEERAWLES